MRLSVVVPALNEATLLGVTLRALQELRLRGGEVIVVDGGSDDGTVSLSQQEADRVLRAPRGRARQMNAGAAAATGDVVLFLHADTVLDPNVDHVIETALSGGASVWGRFDVRLSGTHPLLRLVERMINWRSRLSGIATGDQAIFVRRDVFVASGGYPDIPLMEDVALCKRLKASYGRPAALRERVVTSSRRWEQHGVLRTIVLMWWLRLVYALGVDPHRLIHYYKSTRCDIRPDAF
jgi:rSAM/selenodomain-associated transferase 2